MSMPDLFLAEELALYERLSSINYGPKVKFVLRPLEYAGEIHDNYLRKYCQSTKKVLFLGLNPGPWGMMQNGVPFGEVGSVRDFLQLEGNVTAPPFPGSHPQRPILGLSSTRREVSGRRFWTLASQLSSGVPQKFFENAFVHNYFPFCLLDDQGRNVTPPDLKNSLSPEVQLFVDRLCAESLLKVTALLRVEVIIAVGRYVETKLQRLIKLGQLPPVQIVYLPHPSPRNPASNCNWLETAKTIVVNNKMGQYFDL